VAPHHFTQQQLRAQARPLARCFAMVRMRRLKMPINEHPATSLSNVDKTAQQRNLTQWQTPLTMVTSRNVLGLLTLETGPSTGNRLQVTLHLLPRLAVVHRMQYHAC